jgi:cold shock CspA family protein
MPWAARGKVEQFDKEAGLGVLRAEDGVTYPFHCTEVAGGSRDILVGAEVVFEVAPGHTGVWEARSVQPI